MGWPQAIWIAIMAIGLGIHIAKHGKFKQPEKFHAGARLVYVLLMAGLLYWGGFWDGVGS